MMNIFSQALVAMGGAFMLASILGGLKVKSEVPKALQPRWTFISGLMVFFLIGYIAFLTIQVKQLAFPLELLTSVIFFWGAIFVFLMVHLTRNTIGELAESREQISIAHSTILQERDKLETLTRSIGAGITIISEEYQVVWMNEELTDMYGDCVGKHCYSALHGFSKICPGCDVQDIFRQKIAQTNHELPGKDINDRPVWSQIITTPIHNGEGKVEAALEVIIPITERKKAEAERERLIDKLQQALDDVRQLSGMLPICSWCKKIRDDKGYWTQLEQYISNFSSAKFTHGICPDCVQKKMHMKK